MLWQPKDIKARFNNLCFGCLSCNGKKCAGQFPGMGGVGEGLCFQSNVSSIQNLKLNSHFFRNEGESNQIDTSTKLFDCSLSIPILGAPIAGMWRNLPNIIDEEDLLRSLLYGAHESKTIGMTGGGLTSNGSPLEWISLKILAEINGVGIPILKPQIDNKELIKQIKEAENLGCPAVGVNIDSGSELPCWEFKSVDVWRDIISQTKIPFIFKGILSIEDAEMAVAANASTIIISNHGGRIMDSLPPVAIVLPKIVESVGSNITILADGGIRSGEDVFKMLALGAKAVLVGRPLIHGAVMEGIKGVKMVFEKFEKELKTVMKTVGVSTVDDIYRRKDSFLCGNITE